MPGALQALRALQAKCDLVVITSRQNVIQDATAKWVETHFPGIFSDLYFCNHFALDGESVTKAAMCSRVGADLLIDDNAGYALDCAKSGLDVILFDYQSTYRGASPAMTARRSERAPTGTGFSSGWTSSTSSPPSHPLTDRCSGPG